MNQARSHQTQSSNPFFNRGGQTAFYSATQESVQTKLSIGKLGDPYEQEADAMAEKVGQRLSQPEVQQKTSNDKATPIISIAPAIQAKCATCEQEEKLQLKEESELPEGQLLMKYFYESNALPPEDEIQRKCAECETVEKVQTKRGADSSENFSMSCLESRLSSSKGSGSPLPDTTREQMESSFGVDFSNIRIHTGSNAMQMNQDLNARAFTHGADIYFNSGKYNSTSREGQLWLAHELTHTIQQDKSAGNKFIQRTPAEDLIESHTFWGDLDENALGSDLKNRAIQYDDSFVNLVFDDLGWMNLDDVANELIVASTDTELDVIASDENERRLLDLLYDFLTAGNLSQEEQTQSDRILAAKSRQMNVMEFPQDIDDINIFPFRLPGITVLSDAPITAERRPEGTIHVEMPVRVLGAEGFRDVTRTLPNEPFISGFDLPGNEIVMIKLYDLGGLVVFMPALYLIRLSNKTTTQVISAMIEAAGIGLTIGAGEFILLGAEATMAVKAVLWADRDAYVLGTLTSVLDLTSTENAQHLRSNEAQAEGLLKMLGDEWILQGVRDFYHGYKFIGLEETVEQVGDVFRLFGFNG